MKKLLKKIAAVCLCISLSFSMTGRTGYAQEMISECEVTMQTEPETQEAKETEPLPETDPAPETDLVPETEEYIPETLVDDLPAEEPEQPGEIVTDDPQETSSEVLTEVMPEELTEEMPEELAEEMSEMLAAAAGPAKAPLGTLAVKIRKARDYRYANYGLGSYITGEYHVSINGITSDSLGYCMNPGLPGAVSGNFPVITESRNIERILYYSQGNYAGDKNWFKVNGYDGWAAGKKYIIIHLAVARNNNSQSLSTGATAQALAYANSLRNYALSMPDPPDPALSLSKSKLTAYQSGNIQRTDEVTLKGSTENQIELQLGKGMKLVNVTQGRTSAAGALVKISGGDHFYFTAPLDQAEKNGASWKSGTLQGASVYAVQSYRVYEHDYSHQDLVFMTATPSQDEVSMSVKWYSEPKPETGSVKLIKIADPLNDGSRIVKNLHFLLTYEEDPSLTVELVTDADGTAEASELKPGVWHLEETTHNRFYELAEATNVTVTAGKTTEVTVHNHRTSGSLRIVKVDSESGKTITRSHATFSILDFAGNPVKMKVKGAETETDVFETDEYGEVNFEDELISGKYVLHEITAPDGYDTGQDIAFEITTRKRDTLVLSMADEPIKRRFSVTKIDEKTGERLGAGYSFTVRAVSDILDASGEKRQIPEMTIVTNAEGVAQTDWLYPGIYEVKETAVSASEGMSLREDAVQVDLTKYTEAEEMNIVNLEFKDTPTQLSLLKTDADTGKPMQGVEFRIGTNPDDPDEGELYTTDEDGRISLCYLKAGTTYYIKEVRTRDGYCPDPQVHEVCVDQNGLIEGKSSYELKLSNQPNVVEISKQELVKGADGAEIPGAHLRVEDTDGNLIDEWISEDVPHMIKGLKAGEYVLTETIAPEGYARSTKAVQFAVEDSMKVQRVVFYNTPTKVYIHKQDITDTKELPGAKLEVWTADGTLLESWISTDEPHYMERMPVGKYILKEITAPEGYEASEEVEFEITDSEQIQIVRMFDNRLPEKPETESEPETEPETKPETPKPPKTPGTPGTPTTPSKPGRPSSPKTGDTVPVTEMMLLMAAAFITMVVSSRKVKQK